MTSQKKYNEFTTNNIINTESLLMNIILYLFQTIQYLYQQNCWLINFIWLQSKMQYHRKKLMLQIF